MPHILPNKKSNTHTKNPDLVPDLVIGNFIILELSPLKFHHEIPCYWVKFHAIINFTREAQVLPTYVRTYAFTVLPYYPMYYFHGTS